jgi:hypothetical protein
MLMSDVTYKQLKNVTAVWQLIASTPPVFHLVSEFGKLAELYLSIPMGSVENERVFSGMNYLESTQRNRLLSPHLNICARVFTAKPRLKSFDFGRVYTMWKDTAGPRGRYKDQAIESECESEFERCESEIEAVEMGDDDVAMEW